MMRRYHRWLSVFFGVLILWIALTGLASHFASLVANGGFGDAPPAAAAPPAGFICPDTMTCRVKPVPNPARPWVGYLHHLHSGEEFGPVGTVLAMLSGAALIFFALSGVWMYLHMFRARGRKRRAGGRLHGGKVFWS